MIIETDIVEQKYKSGMPQFEFIFQSENCCFSQKTQPN